MSKKGRRFLQARFQPGKKKKWHFSQEKKKWRCFGLTVSGGDDVVVVHAAALGGDGVPLLADVTRAGLLLDESTALHRPEPGRKLEGDTAPLVLPVDPWLAPVLHTS